MQPHERFPRCFNLILTVGEYFVPHADHDGAVRDHGVRGIPGARWIWADVKTPEQHLAKSKWILDTFMPWEAERCNDVELTDANGILAGACAHRAQARGDAPIGAARCSAWAMWSC
jgi:hypothetical protein